MSKRTRSNGPSANPSGNTSLLKLATEIGISVPTLRAWMSHGCPVVKNEDGTYDIESVLSWAEKNVRKRRGRPLGGGGLRNQSEDDDALKILKLKAEITKLTEEARGKALKNNEYEGLLLPADDVRQWIASKFLRIKSRLEQLPEELQLLAPANLRAQLYTDLSNAIHELLLEMSGWEVKAEQDDLAESA